MENSGTKAAICQVNFGLLQKQFPHVFLLFHFCFLFFFSVPVSFFFLLFFPSFVHLSRPPSPTACPPQCRRPASTGNRRKQQQQRPETAAEVEAAETDRTTNFWSLPEPIPTSYSGDLRLFGKLSSSTTVFQLESLRSVSGSSRNQHLSEVGHSCLGVDFELFLSVKWLFRV